MLKTRGLETSFTMSELLVDNPESKALIDMGTLIPDSLVRELYTVVLGCY